VPKAQLSGSLQSLLTLQVPPKSSFLLLLEQAVAASNATQR
jgi:hypothetical protein